VKKLYYIASNIGLLLFTCVIISLNFIAFDGSTGYFVRPASASSHQSSPHYQLDTFDHIILTWTGNPATSQAVTWRSLIDFKNSFAEIAPAQASPDFVKNAEKITAETTPLQTGSGSVYYHSVNFTDLGPNTLYAYRVGNGDIWSEWFQFRTASRHVEPFVFLYFGDAQNNIFSLWSRAIRTAVLKAPTARFMIHAGDMVEHKNNAREWNEWFSAGGWIFATIPSLPVTGNH